MLMHQADLLGVTDDADWDGDGFRDDKTKTAKRKAKKKAAEEAERATLPLKTPNDASCWYYSNGLECPNKFKDSTLAQALRNAVTRWGLLQRQPSCR
jgi:hypothetical protein